MRYAEISRVQCDIKVSFKDMRLRWSSFMLQKMDILYSFIIWLQQYARSDLAAERGRFS